VAAAQIDNLRLRQQAEELKQVRNGHCRCADVALNNGVTCIACDGSQTRGPTTDPD
jgi:hypothetical protein